MGVDAATPPGFWERVRQIVRDEIAKLLRSGLLRSASIGEGGLTLRGGFFRVLYPETLGGKIAVYFGNIVSAVNGSRLGTGLLIQGPDGTDLLSVRTDEQFGTTMHNIYDSAGRIIFGNDAASGQGIARPYISGALYRQRYTDWTVSSTSTGWETLYATRILKQHPKLEIGVRASTTAAGTTGEVRALVNGVQLGDVSPVAFVAGFHTFGPAPVTGDHMVTLDVEIQARVITAGATVRVEPWYGPTGRQT